MAPIRPFLGVITLATIPKLGGIAGDVAIIYLCILVSLLDNHIAYQATHSKELLVLQ